MSGEEVSQTLQEQPLQGEAKDVPLQVSPVVVQIPRPIDFLGLMHQWQPMGIRITLKLPFVSNDWGFLFLIRNGPFIPRLNRQVDKAIAPEGNIDVYAYNNLRNVFLLPDDGNENEFVSYPSNYPLSLSVYDHPPVLSTIAHSFRRWRGDMQYRVRVVAGFGTQGYLVAGNLKNEMMPIGIYDEYRATPNITRMDASYRQMMMNGYVMSDTSMFRHLEVTVPYDYPTDWYDQFQWIENRVAFPGVLALPTKPKSYAFREPMFLNEISGDDFVAIGVRGSIEAKDTTVMAFELEYRAMEGFQFGEPGLPSQDMLYNRRKTLDVASWARVKTIPNLKMWSDGVGRNSDSPINISKLPAVDDLTISEPIPPIRPRSPPPLNPLFKTLTTPITYPSGHPLGPFKSCAVDRRGGSIYTHCQRADQSWVSFYDDVRTAIQLYDTEQSLWSDKRLRVASEDHLRGLARTARERDFT